MTQMLRSRRGAAFAAVVAALFCGSGSASPAPAPVAQAAVAPASRVSPDALCYLTTDHVDGADLAATAAGLTALTEEARRRTSLALGLPPHPLRAAEQKSHDSPLWIWREQGRPAAPTTATAATLQAFLSNGGMLWVDAPDGATDGPFFRYATEVLERIWPGKTLVPVPADHVLFKSFYLITGPLGRFGGAPPPLGLFFEGRLCAILTRQDILGAIAQRADGSAMLPLADGDSAQREMSLRFGINWLMYAQCLDYKDDQVHLPFLLRRRP